MKTYHAGTGAMPATQLLTVEAQALAGTGATVAFDAIGGGALAGQILTAMEIPANRTAKEYSRYDLTFRARSSNLCHRADLRRR